MVVCQRNPKCHALKHSVNVHGKKPAYHTLCFSWSARRSYGCKAPIFNRASLHQRPLVRVARIPCSQRLVTEEFADAEWESRSRPEESDCVAPLTSSIKPWSRTVPVNGLHTLSPSMAFLYFYLFNWTADQRPGERAASRESSSHQTGLKRLLSSLPHWRPGKHKQRECTPIVMPTWVYLNGIHWKTVTENQSCNSYSNWTLTLTWCY